MRTLVLLPALAVILGGSAVQASDDDFCTKAPKEQWLKLGDVEAKLSEKGFKTSEIEFEDGCVEAKVTDKDGKRLKLKLDPTTAEVVRTDDRSKGSDR